MHDQRAKRIRAKYPTSKIIQETVHALVRCGVPVEACLYMISPSGQLFVYPNPSPAFLPESNHLWSAWEQSRGE